jgi:hypothetical protein
VDTTIQVWLARHDLGMVYYKALIGLSLLRVPHFRARHGASLKSYELSRKGHPNHDASLTSKAFVTSTHVGGHVVNPTNTTDSSALEFALSSLSAASDEQYESIPDDEIALPVRKFRALHRFHKERRRSPRG